MLTKNVFEVITVEKKEPINLLKRLFLSVDKTFTLMTLGKPISSLVQQYR